MTTPACPLRRHGFTTALEVTAIGLWLYLMVEGTSAAGRMSEVRAV
jgi:hypothetical protein